MDWSLWLETILLLTTAVYVSAAVWFWRGMKPLQPPRSQGSSNAHPGVSVVVAARDEETHIAACLESLLAQTYPAERYEIIVVDDGSTDGTADIVRQYSAAQSQIRLLNAAEALGCSGSKKAALGLAVSQAKQEIILTTDADCLVPPGWIEAMAGAFDEDVGMAIGYAQIAVPKDGLGLGTAFESVDFLNLMAGAWGSVGQGHPFAASGQNLAYRKEAFQAVGGFTKVQHRTSGDDLLLLHLIRGLGLWRVVFVEAPESWVDHPPASSGRSFLNKRIRWASNGPYQIRMDPLFFAYLSIAFTVNLLLVAGVVLWAFGGLDGELWLGAWLAKGLGEWLVFVKATSHFNRRALRRYFIAWALVQPFYTVWVGSLGIWGRFTWKGRKNRWGQPAS